MHPARIFNFGLNSDSRTGAIVVSSSDTLWKISQKYRVPLRSIIDANNLHPPYRLSNGQRLIIPAPLDYEVRESDSLYSIAKMFDTSVYKLAKENDLQTPFNLRVGQTLRIPYQYDNAEREQIASNKAEYVAEDKSPGPMPIKLGNFDTTEVETEVLYAPEPSDVKHEITADKAPINKAMERGRPSNIVVSSSNAKFIWPVKGKVISGYGAKPGGLYNDGINIAVPKGEAVKASADGVVAYVGGDLKTYGNLILIKHSKGMTTAYAHLDKVKVRKGDRISRGQTIGSAGSSGRVSSTQLHFEIRKGSKTFDPKKYL